ncbi:MAG TPA: trypsin-like peptidase domain-containing protein [Candidatus Baltobacteraceae bacterium]|nr:trypsin-like peptidase domain-containing protein [Candidatus Baltobacteraceae bacterium]
MSSEWATLSKELAETTAKAGAHAVAVHTESRGSSSGVIWRPGIVVTAEHALQRDEDIQLTLPDGSVASAKLVGRDASTDVAVLKCEEANSAVPSFSDTTTLHPGNVTLVVGRTRASGPIAALAFVSMVADERRLWGGLTLSPYVRLDVALPHTAVGGAVVDSEGRIAGIATPKFAPAGALALPVATVNRVADGLLAQGRIPRGYLGVGLQPIRLPENIRDTLQRREKTAAIVLEVEPGGPAHNAGVVIGDILISLATKPVTRLEDVQVYLHGENIGKSVAALFLRGGAPRDVNITVAERPNGRE